MIRSLMLYLTALVLGGCPGDPIIEDPTFEADIGPLFEATCTRAGCHDAATAGGDLDMETDPYNALVNAPSTVAGMDVVEPGDRTNSYLWHKINGTFLSVGGEGASMPLSGAQLTDNEITNIGNWIDDGAP